MRDYQKKPGISMYRRNCCNYCGNRLTDQTDVCDGCQKVVEANPALAAWVLDIVKSQIEMALSDHVSKYDHKYSENS